MEIKKIKTIIGCCLLCLILTYFFINATNNILEPFLYNNESASIDQWDLLQIVFGYYTSVDESAVTYLELKNWTQIGIPIIVQLIGFFLGIYFLQIPLSFHTFVKTRIKSTTAFITYFFKKSFLMAINFILTLAIAVMLVFTFSPLALTTSSCQYQMGNVYLALIGYFLTLFLMINALSLIVFWGYVKNRGIMAFSLCFIVLILLNIFNRVLTTINFIQFDAQNNFIDSIAFWLLLIIIALVCLQKTDLYQEEYND